MKREHKLCSSKQMIFLLTKALEKIPDLNKGKLEREEGKKGKVCTEETNYPQNT